MPTKRIHVLANSVKNSQHCIAGREVLTDYRGNLFFGGWIRPVSRHGEGELSWTDCRFPDGKTPAICDVVDIPLQEHQNCPYQPENWFIDAKTIWKKIAIHPEDLPDLKFDSPRRLWMAPGQQQDRISPAALTVLNCGASLYLIEVQKFRIQLSWKEREGKTSKRRRALFRYRDFDYEFSLTDPAMDRYTTPFPKPEDGTKTIFLPGNGNCFLCVSLTPPFLDYHYKVVATVIEP